LTRSLGRALASVSWVAALAACDPTPSDSERVRAAVEEVRARPSSDVAGRRAATQRLAALDVAEDRAREARDACARAYEASTNLFEGLGTLERRGRSGELGAADAAELGRLDAPSELEGCTRSLTSLD
jgi:hypothetical protein